jgi:hypothetical protein
MAWAWWLAAPFVVPVLAAIVMWWRGRPRQPVQTAESVVGHQKYLQALGSAIRTEQLAGRDAAATRSVTHPAGRPSAQSVTQSVT